VRQVCLFLISLYPASWRNRYGVEYEAMLRAWEGAGVRDAVDMLVHCGSIWLRPMWAPSQRPATVAAAIFLAMGMACAVTATQGGEQLWRGATMFFVLSLLQIPTAGVVGFVTARGPDGVVRGIGLLSASILAPGIALWIVSQVMAAGADALTLQAYVALDPYPRAESAAAALREALGSRELLSHWGRSSLLTAAGSVPLGWLVGLAGVWIGRKWRTRRRAEG